MLSGREKCGMGNQEGGTTVQSSIARNDVRDDTKYDQKLRRDISVWRRLLRLLFLVVSLFGAGTAHALISCNSTAVPNYAPVLNTVAFPRDAPMGSATPQYSTTLSFHCQGDPGAERDIHAVFAASPATLVSGYTDVFTTNVSGIGVRYTIANASGTSCRSLPITVPTGTRDVICHQLVGATTPGFNYSLSVSAQFIKTGDSMAGTLTTIPALSVTNLINNQSGSTLWGNVFSGVATGIFARTACTVTTTALQVAMAQARSTDFPALGSTTANTPLGLELVCDAGVKVAVTLSDVTAPSNRSTTLSLTSDSTAQGIGYQVLYAGSPVSYGPDSPVAGNVSQFMVTPGPTSGGPVSVALAVRYVRTGAVSPGTANAKATFTMSYQ